MFWFFRSHVDDIYTVVSSEYENVYNEKLYRERELKTSYIENIGLGYDEKKIQAVKDSGMLLNLRPASYPRVNQDKLIDAYYADVDKYHADNTHMVFQGSYVLGYENEEKTFSKKLRDELIKRGSIIGLIEADDQLGFVDMLGMEELAKASDYQCVRLFAVVDYIQRSYNYRGQQNGSKEIQNIMYRSAIDRNIRSIYMRPFRVNRFRYVEDLEEYKVLIDEYKERLEPHNIKIGSCVSMKPTSFYTMFYATLLCYGVLIVFIFTFRLIFGIHYKLELGFVAFCMIAIPLCLKIAPDKSLLVASLGTTIIFPLFAFIVYLEYVRSILGEGKIIKISKIIGKAVVGLIIPVLICLIGGLYVGAILSRHDFLLEIKYFRGVKLNLLLPTVIAVAIYAIKLGFGKKLERDELHYDHLLRMLKTNVKLYTLIIAGFIAGAVLLYMSRSGNNGNVPDTSIELIVRSFLENSFIVRPRFKEFLFGFPSVFIAIYLACHGHKRSTFPFMIFSVLGFSSILNTFSHIRTSVYVSVLRTLISAGLSILIGILLIIVLDVIFKVIDKMKRKKMAVHMNVDIEG